MPVAKRTPSPSTTGFRSLASLDGGEDAARVSMMPRIGPAGERIRLGDVFTPSQPRTLGPLFVGRDSNLRRLVTAVQEERSHVILFGDRGRGKTSLANAFSDIATRAGYTVLRSSCGVTTTFEGLFHSLLAGLPSHLVGPSAAGRDEPLLPEGRFGAGQLTQALRRVRNGHLVLLIDEFDRAKDEALRVDLAEAIKNVSDAAAPATFFIVGVAQSLDDLLGQHPSLQRNLVAMHLTRMTDDETRRLIQAGAKAAGIRFAEEVSGALVGLARGMPFYAHLLCLFAARAANNRSSVEVTKADLKTAVAEVVAEQGARFAHIYADLVQGTPEMEDMLFAAANAQTDSFGRFKLAALTAALAATSGSDGTRLEPAEHALRELVARGSLVGVDGPSDDRYAFADPALAHYILFRQAGRRGLLPGSSDPSAPSGTDLP